MNKLKNFIYPPFSEVDAFALLISLLVPFLFKLDNIQKLSKFTKGLDLSDSLVFVGILVFWFFIVIRNILIKKTLTDDEKSQMAHFFYFFIGIITFLSSIEILFKPAKFFESFTLIVIINITIHILLFFRALISLVGLRFMRINKNILVSQVKDVQARSVEIGLIMLSAIVIYYLFLTEYPLATSILLTYFYSSTAVKLIEKVVIKNRSTN